MFCSSYDLLSKKQAELERKNYQLIIIDESHCIKNDKSARTRAAEPLMKVTNREQTVLGIRVWIRTRRIRMFFWAIRIR